MRRYRPSPEEAQALIDAGWRYAPANADEDAWFWPPNTLGLGWTYKEARREQDRRERQARRKQAQHDK